VVEQQELAAGARHPAHLDDRGPVVGHAAQRQGAHHGVERGIAEGKTFGFSLAQVDGQAEVRSCVCRQRRA
jgi:hypothetical protein